MTTARFTLRQLEIFLAMARTRNVTKAADALQMSPSATSAAITDLERAVGANLCIRRKGRGVQLTPEGRMFEQLATRLVDDAAELSITVAEHGSGSVHGTLRLGYVTPLSAAFLPDLMQTFTSQYPGVDIELVEGDDDELHAMSLNGLVDVTLTYEPPTHPDLESMHLVSRRPYVLVAKSHPFADRERISMAELADEPLILITVGARDEQILSWFASFGLTPNVRWETHDIALMRALVGRGLGYAVLLQRQRHDLTLDGREVHSLELEPPVDPIRVYLTLSPSGRRTKRSLAFVDVAHEIYRNPPAWMGLVPAPQGVLR